ncbi:MAG: hypothetical protein GYA68_14660 [Syntrophorhabdus sp.]|nr:hypothetical protein [Syntrophorhabdus sp.]
MNKFSNMFGQVLQRFSRRSSIGNENDKEWKGIKRIPLVESVCGHTLSAS